MMVYCLHRYNKLNLKGQTPQEPFSVASSGTMNASYTITAKFITLDFQFLLVQMFLLIVPLDGYQYLSEKIYIIFTFYSRAQRNNLSKQIMSMVWLIIRRMSDRISPFIRVPWMHLMYIVCGTLQSSQIGVWEVYMLYT